MEAGAEAGGAGRSGVRWWQGSSAARRCDGRAAEARRKGRGCGRGSAAEGDGLAGAPSKLRGPRAAAVRREDTWRAATGWARRRGVSSQGRTCPVAARGFFLGLGKEDLGIGNGGLFIEVEGVRSSK